MNLPMFSKSQLKTISEICNGIGQVYFASIAIPFLLADIQRAPVFVFGLGSALTFWIISISLSNSTRRIKT